METGYAELVGTNVVDEEGNVLARASAQSFDKLGNERDISWRECVEEFRMNIYYHTETGWMWSE